MLHRINVVCTVAVDGWVVTLIGTARRGLGGAAACRGPSSLCTFGKTKCVYLSTVNNITKTSALAKQHPSYGSGQISDLEDPWGVTAP